MVRPLKPGGGDIGPEGEVEGVNMSNARGMRLRMFLLKVRTQETADAMASKNAERAKRILSGEMPEIDVSTSPKDDAND